MRCLGTTWSTIRTYHRKNSPVPQKLMFKKRGSNFFPSRASTVKDNKQHNFLLAQSVWSQPSIFNFSKERKLIILSALFLLFHWGKSELIGKADDRESKKFFLSLILKFKSLFSCSFLPHLQASHTSELIQTSLYSFLSCNNKTLFIVLITLFSSTCITIACLFHWLSASTKHHPSFSWPVQKRCQLCSSASSN